MVFVCGYTTLSYFLNEQEQLAAKMLEKSAIKEEIRSLNGLFYEIRFWERKIIEEDNPEANAKFGTAVKQVKEQLSAIQEKHLSDPLLSKLGQIQQSLTVYEKNFNRFIQLKTSRNLHRTVMETSYQSLVTNILNTDKQELFKPLFNLIHFFINYLMHQSDNGYQALILVTDYLGKKIEASVILDDRTMQYLISFKDMIQKDHELTLEMKGVKGDFDLENKKLMDLFDIVFTASDQLLKQDFLKAEEKRQRLNQSALVLTTLTLLFLFISFFLFSKSIATPIRSVSKTMSRVKNGNPDARFSPQGNEKDELIQFGLYFNAMLDSLQESEKKYKDLFESSLDAILLLDPKKGYLDCNSAAMEIFCIQSKDQLSGLTPLDLTPTHQPDGTPSLSRHEVMMTEVKKKGAHISEWTCLRLNGEQFFASMLVTRVTVGGETILQSTIRDISDYKQAQEMIIQSEKMLSVGGLAAGMAHEINNPLAGMIQTGDVMAKRLNQTDLPANLKVAEEIGIRTEDIRTYMEKRDIFRMLETIKASGARMAEIVSNMLGFARKGDDRTSSHDMTELLDKTLELAATDFDLKKHYDFKTIEIKKEYEKDLPPVPCEGAKIQQVFLNILRNGAEAMQEAGTDNPQFHIKVYFNENMKRLCTEIKDNGTGIAPSTLKRIFEPFFTTKPVGVGTGLGLSVSYFIITENHKGQLSVTSKPGSGAQFLISLPVDLPQ